MFVDDERAMPLTRRVCRGLAERGWLTLAWPREHGGRDAGPWMQTVLREEMWAAEEPRGPQYMNLNYIGPLIMRFGTADQQRRFLPPMAAGDVLWCQGFSEPDAGSDLASVRTRAVDHEDHFVVDGQKIWTSYADAPADWCLLLARTDPEAPKHAGLSLLLLDMTTPGITVRPIDTMAGPHEFCEVFLDGVVVPRDCLLGARDHGWELVGAGLTFERVGIARYARAGRVIELMVEHANATGQAHDPDVRAVLADLRARYEVARLLSYHAISLQAAASNAGGEGPTVEASIARIHNTQLEQAVGHAGLEILGPEGALRAGDSRAPLAGELHRYWTRNIPTTVAAGTLEIQKNIVARRGLDLPAAR